MYSECEQNHENCGHKSWFPDQETKPGLREHEAECLPSDPPFNLVFEWIFTSLLCDFVAVFIFYNVKKQNVQWRDRKM
jgi:hypothetical protein